MRIQPHHLKKGLLALSVSILSFGSRAQDFLIKHDFQKDKTEFFQVTGTKDTVMVKEINLKRPGHISLKVDNLNPFVYDAKVTVFKTEQEELSSYIGLFLTGLVKATGSSSFFNISRGDGMKSFTGTNTKWKEKLEDLNNKAEAFRKAKEELIDLKYNVKKTEAEIKTEAGNIVFETFGTRELGIKEMRAMGRDLDKERKQVRDSLGSTTVLPISFFDELSYLTTIYNQVVSTPFRFHYVISENADIKELKLQLFARPDTMLVDQSRDTITRYFEIKARNNLRVRNSLGISFTYFSDNNRSYYVKSDTTIGRANRDLFTPLLSTFLNFYISRTAGFKWGGSFGFGIPLLGERKEINFLLGLCTILGRNEPIVLSAGVAGAKVERLTEGWQVGQKVPDLNFNIPTASQFRMGGYFSLSFNLNSLSAGNRNE